MFLTEASQNQRTEKKKIDYPHDFIVSSFFFLPDMAEIFEKKEKYYQRLLAEKNKELSIKTNQLKKMIEEKEKLKKKLEDYENKKLCDTCGKNLNKGDEYRRGPLCETCALR